MTRLPIISGFTVSMRCNYENITRFILWNKVAFVRTFANWQKHIAGLHNLRSTRATSHQFALQPQILLGNPYYTPQATLTTAVHHK